MTTRERSVPFAEYDNTDTHKNKEEWNWEFCGRVIGQLLPTIEEKGFTHFHIHFSLLFLFHYYYCNALFHSARVRRDIKCLLFIQFPLELKETKKRIPSLFLVSGIRKKKTTSTIFFFLPSFIHLVRYRMNGSGTINTHGPYFSTSASSISLFPSCAIT